MPNSSSPSLPAVKVIRWVARILSALWILIMLAFFVGEGLLGGDSPHSRPINTTDIIQLILGGIELVGLGVAWKLELVGGSITLVAYFIKAIVNPRTLMFPLILVPLTAILFLLCWWLSRAQHQEKHGVTQNG